MPAQLNTIETILGWFQLEERDGLLTALQPLSATIEKRCPVSDLAVRVRDELNEYARGELRRFTIPCRQSGTSFQLRVWAELSKIPYGETRTYGEIASRMGLRGGARAIGAACHRNPILIIVPCHRVIGAHGGLTGYAGGLVFKQMLLKHEQTYSGRTK